MSDSYPEYLNPFAEDVKPKNKLSISHSFKEFKRTLRQSFRIKKKEEEPITIRQKTDTLRRIPVSYPNYRTDALPRSRFQERVKGGPSTSSPGPNPFEEEEEDRSLKKQTLRKKTKKKAPLPPKSLSSQDINNDNLDVPTHGSRWSLTSGDTNYSSSVQENGGEDVDEVNEAVLEKIIDFNKEMEKLKDDSNNNVITTEEINQKNDISNENNSCPDEIDSTTKLESNKEKTYDSLPQENHSSRIENTSDEALVTSDIVCENNKNSTSTEDNQAIEKNVIFENDTNCTSTADDEGIKPNDTDVIVENKVNSSSAKDDEGTEEANENVICENKMNGTSTNDDEGTDSSDKEPFLYYEKQSLYIAGSRDELNDSEMYTNRVSLHISEASDDLDVCNNNDVYEENQSNTNEDKTPVAKQRKNKLTKSALLGM